MKNKNTRNPSGAGSIRQRPDGRWEARYTAGRNPGTGRQIQKSIYGATQKEVLEKLRNVQVAHDTGTHIEPTKMTVKAWLDIWVTDYLGHAKDATQRNYRDVVGNHITPALGALSLQKLKPHQIQAFYNSMQMAGLSARTVHNVHAIFHSALKQAIENGYIRTNPTEACTMPRLVKKEMKVMDEATVAAFIEAIQDDQFEAIYFIDLLTGLRLSEILGLTWECVDFKNGTLTIAKQLLKERKKGGEYYLDTPKNGKPRKIKPAAVVMDKLKSVQRQQIKARLKAGPVWDNPMNLVLTDESGRYFVHSTVYKQYKRIVTGLGVPDLRFHDMRHSYAVMALMNGDDPKTVQGNLGHHTAAFTLDVYGHVTEKMQDDSAARMDAYIKGLMSKGNA